MVSTISLLKLLKSWRFCTWALQDTFNSNHSHHPITTSKHGC